MITLGLDDVIEGVLVTSYVNAFDSVWLLDPDVTTTDTCVLLEAVVNGTVQVINAKSVTVGSVHRLPSIVTVEDGENPDPVTLIW